MIQTKTGRLVRFEITETTRPSLERWISDTEMIGVELPWPSGIHCGTHRPTRHHARTVRGWVMSPGLRPSAHGTHSMRRTKVARICKKSGKLRAVQLLQGLRKMGSRVRWPSVEGEEALTLSEGIDMTQTGPKRSFAESGLLLWRDVKITKGDRLARHGALLRCLSHCGRPPAVLQRDFRPLLPGCCP